MMCLQSQNPVFIPQYCPPTLDIFPDVNVILDAFENLPMICDQWIQPNPNQDPNPFLQMQQLRNMAIRPADGIHQSPLPKAASDGYDPAHALDLAKRVRGKRSDGLHTTPELKGAYRNPQSNRKAGQNLNDLNCANFVSALLLKSGGIAKGTGSSNVTKLETSLQEQGWVQRPQGSQPQPGDVWFSENRGHVEIVSKVGQGKVWTTGSNNIGSDRTKPDGSPPGEAGQWVTQRVKTSPGFFYAPPGQV